MNIEQLSIDTIRVIGAEAITKASSGHPGMLLGSAPIGHTLFTKILNATPKDPKWISRDRFVLASGHASMLLYMLLHLAGYPVTMDDIKAFRQLNSKTPGHPEIEATVGVDCSSGPLGQGISHAVGLAMGEKFMAENFNKPSLPIFDNYTYVLCGDGDMEEGVTQEAISLAANLKLNKLIVLYDSNRVTLDGELGLSSKEDTKARFVAAGWKVFNVDGFDIVAVERAIKRAKKVTDRPSLIICDTIIGYGSVNQDTCKVHGSPLSSDDITQMREKLGYDYPSFEVPTEVYRCYQETFGKRGTKAYNRWKRNLRVYKKLYPEDYLKLKKALDGKDLVDVVYPSFPVDTNEATRVTSGKVVNEIAKYLPTLVGGASDVAKSVNTELKGLGVFGLDENGKNVYYGIREFAMSCAQTGMLLYGGVRPYVGCFLVFSDYMKASIRTAALMNQPSINVFTHDSIAVGEDGPTHQPIEQISSLRLIPNTTTIRPAGAIETSHAWRYAIENRQGPVNLILSRQNIPTTGELEYADFKRGAYVVIDEKNYDYVLVASGSEVALATEVSKLLLNKNIRTKVVSMPSCELFDRQSEAFKKRVLGSDHKKVIALEMGAGATWYKYASKVYSIDKFGLSGKSGDVIKEYGFTSTDIAGDIANLK